VVPCVAVEVNATEEIAIQSLFDLLKSQTSKGDKSGKNIKIEKALCPSISTDIINIYASSTFKDNNNSTVYVFINKGNGSDFVSSATDAPLVESLKNYLDTKYLPAAAKASLDAKIAAQTKLIQDSNKKLVNYQKDHDSKLRQREKLSLEIENLSKQIDDQKVLLEQQKLDLDRIGK
jgi:hypothetical protein